MSHTPAEDREIIDNLLDERDHTATAAADDLYASENLCTTCGGPRSLAVHSAWASGVGVADHEFQPSPHLARRYFTVIVTDGKQRSFFLEEGYSLDGVLSQLGESPQHRERAAQRFRDLMLHVEGEESASG